MNPAAMQGEDLVQRLAEAEATLEALLSGQIDAVVDVATQTPVLLATAQEALRQSEERYRRIVETANEGVWQIDADNKTTFMNLRMARMLGCETDMGIGRSPFEFLDVDEQDALRDHLRASSVHQVDVRFTALDGSGVWTLLEATPIYDASGRYDGTFAMVMDITQRREAEAALRASEARFRRLWESGTILISISDLKGRITELNDAGLRLLGCSRGEVLAGHVVWADVTPAEWSVDADDAREELRAMGVALPREKEIVRRDGTFLPLLITRATLGEGQVISIAIDMTGRRAAEAALRKSEQQYREIVEATSDGIVKLDAEARIVFVNGRFAEMLGYEPAEMIGMSAYEYMLPSRRKIAEQTFQRRRQGLADSVDTTYQHRDGTEISVHIAGSPLIGSKGEYLGSLAVVRDVSERRKLQAQLMVSDRMASVGTLAAGVAHEINNPLTAVVANLDYIAESFRRMSGGASASVMSEAWLREEIQGPLDDAREAAERVRFIVRDLKIFSRSPADEPGGSVDVKTIMESSVRMAWNEIRHRAQLVKDYGEVPLVAANEARLGQVFLNLVVNAAQALPEGRAEHNEIRVHTWLEDGRVIVEVGDTGPGIPPETIGRIFDSFYTTKSVGVGTGLGLAICHRIVTDLGGELTVRSEVGVGTTFRVALPIAVAKPRDASAPFEKALAASLRGRILVVDDEPAVLRIVNRLLSRDHEVVTVASARDALGLCVGGAVFDVILCDLMMPEMSGMELHFELAEVLPEQADRMIFLTGGAFTANARDFLSDTTKEQIEKPFESANLRAIIQRHLRQLP